MRKFLPLGNGRLALQLLAAGAVSALMAGCSSDSTRLSDPFADPFTTSSLPPVHHVASAIPAGRQPPVTSQALAAPDHVASTQPLRPNLTHTAALAPISHETTGSIASGPVRSARGSSFGGWTSSGGVSITIADGETSDTLSKRYGVPETALLQTNGLSSPSDVRPGSNLIIPVYNATAQAAAPAHVAAVSPARASLTKPKAERIAAAQKRIAANPKLAAHAAPAEKVAAATPEHALKAPDQKADAAKPSLRKNLKAQTATVAPAPTKPVAAAAAAAPIKAVKAAAATAAPAVVAQASPAKVDPAPAAAPVADAAGNPEFRWPARGRIIQGFKSGNDGINIALPEGTAIKAAETGTVAYAGSELKGYGNLVLIRHPNGFVTAYANNGELDVKRGDQVKRGQVIAKSGQSGNVSSPQLHFELRKGSTPVDPTTYLAGL